MAEENEDFRDRIATVDEKGKRIWIFPKKPSGKFFNKRKIVSYVLLIVLFALPYIKMEGEPFLMFNILERKFIIFGKIFWPQDFYLFALAMIVGVVFVILFTIIFGRLFCGWVCPQTIFMEMVFRRIEYWIDGDYTHQKKLRDAPWNKEKIFKRVLKHTIFWIISFAIANTFLAYIIGSDQLWQIIREPVSVHLGGFISIIVFTSVFYMVFTRLREQVCTTICPYGRLQGVLLDPNSMVIAYDYVRGEERGKFRKNEDRKTAGKGDCIDCKQCVLVCPTGIDIRNGTQLECVNCTACIDACDHMMEGVGLEKGLIRYVSENGIKDRKPFQWTTRVKAYSALLVFLVLTLITLLVTRNDFQAKVTRYRGTTFQITQDGQVSNIFEIYLLNKTRKGYNIQLKLEGNHGTIETAVKKLRLAPEKELKERFVIKIPYKEVEDKERVSIIVYGNGKEIQRVKTKFIGPNF
ncbi:MAG: cytochrome c oxidase accessory protein CcoG [Flavobacteriia bacterium]|nr:cytochrome c oxidase accessory protein CcoG [Flavobacteriia bacterium]OJX34717.1 MAG: cytochrome c oxidase accessory protein CcoG [Flavobacteriia bacterium 40-80]